MSVESWPIADIRDGRPFARTLQIMRASDVDTSFRQNLRACFQVQRGNSLLRSDTRARDHSSFKRVRTAEHAAGERNLSGLHRLPDHARRDNPAPPENGVDDFRR